MKKEDLKKLGTRSILLIIIGFIMIGTLVSYAFLNDVILLGKKEHSISTCNVNLDLDEGDPISLTAAIPMSDANALSYTPYTFEVVNNDSDCQTINFVINMQSLCPTDETTECNCDEEYQIDSSKIKYHVKNLNTNAISTGTDPFNMSVNASLGTGTSSIAFEIRLWIVDTATSTDLYVSDGVGGYLTNPDSSYVTKNFCATLKLNVATK